MKTIKERISFLPASENPLSADVYVIKGDEKSYIVDVGSNDEALEMIKSIESRIFIITHFHDDHMKNLARLSYTDEELFVGKHTSKVLGTYAYQFDGASPRSTGTVVTQPLEIVDGVKLLIVPMPSCHSKGSLVVAVNDEYLFMGDSFYCSQKGYNASILSEQIRCLKSISFTKVVLSHDEKVYTRDEIISELEAFYQKEIGN